jgi:hypothetical protein
MYLPNMSDKSNLCKINNYTKSFFDPDFFNASFLNSAVPV